MARRQGGKEARDGIEKENRERTRRHKKKKISCRILYGVFRT